MKKFINIIVFAVALLASLLVVIFSAGFNDEARERYDATVYVNEIEPQMIADFEALDVPAIPAYVEKYRALATEKEEALKVEKLQHDIFYTFIYQLEELPNEQLFAEYKDEFPEMASQLFANAEKKDYFVKGFDKVNEYGQLKGYIAEIRKEYAPIHQTYLKDADDIKNINGFIKMVDDVNAVVSATKKEFDLTKLQEDVDGFTSSAGVLNFAIILAYVIFFGTVCSLLAFVVFAIATNLKGSIQMIGALAFLAIVFFLGYALTGEEKAVGGGIITFYVVFFGAILSIIAVSIMGFLKNRQ